MLKLWHFFCINGAEDGFFLGIPYLVLDNKQLRTCSNFQTAKEVTLAEPTSKKHFESQFEFPLYSLIKERAKEKDISYHDAAVEVVPEYVKSIKYGDEDFENAEIEKDARETKAALQDWDILLKQPVKGDR